MVALTEADLAEAKQHLSFRLVDSPARVRELVGVTDTDVELLRRALVDGGPEAAAVHVRDEWLPHFIISGSVGDVTAEIGRLMTMNDIDEFQVAMVGTVGGAEIIEQMATILAE